MRTVGIHPHEAALAKRADFDELEQLARHPKVIAWGEIGLDYFYDHSPRDVQQRVFLQQMELAQAAKLPIIIHCRPSDNSENAWDDCLRLIREHWAPSGLGGVLHCFTGTVGTGQTRRWISGFMISFAGNVTFPKAQNIRDAASMVPLDACSSRPIRRIWRRCRIAASAMSRHSWSKSARQFGELRGLSPEGDRRADHAEFLPLLLHFHVTVAEYWINDFSNRATLVTLTTYA